MKNIIQFLKFGVGGVLNNVVYYFVYILVIMMLNNYTLANAMAFLASVVNAFFWNNRFVFSGEAQDNRKVLAKTFLKTFISYATTGLILNTILLYMWIEWMSIHPLIAPLLNLVVTIPMNFLLNKYWVFRKIKTSK